MLSFGYMRWKFVPRGLNSASSHDSDGAKASQEIHLYRVRKNLTKGTGVSHFRTTAHFPRTFAAAICYVDRWVQTRHGVLRMSVRLGEILIKESLITQDQLQKALEFQRANGGKLGSCLTKMGFITDDDIT